MQEQHATTQGQRRPQGKERAEPTTDLFDRDRVREALAAFAATVREDASRPVDRTSQLTEEQQLARFD